MGLQCVSVDRIWYLAALELTFSLSFSVSVDKGCSTGQPIDLTLVCHSVCQLKDCSTGQPVGLDFGLSFSVLVNRM